MLLFLQSLGKAATENFTKAEKPERDVLTRGKSLIARHRCAACNELPKDLKSEVNRTLVDGTSDWEGGCLAMRDWKRSRPGYSLSKSDRDALRAPIVDNLDFLQQFSIIDSSNRTWKAKTSGCCYIEGRSSSCRIARFCDCDLELLSAITDKRRNPFNELNHLQFGNGLSLIRMSLQKAGGQFQGAAYVFSRPPVADEATFEGPVTCAVSPMGELFVGSIHDSGWGGGQNTGSIVRMKADGELQHSIVSSHSNSGIWRR